MHTIAYFGIMLLIFLRLVGLFIAVEFLRVLKESKFKLLIIGWFIWVLAGFSALILGIAENTLLAEIFHLINGISTSLSIIFVIIGLFTYFRELSVKMLVILSILFISIPLIAFLFGLYSFAYNLSSLSLFLIVIFFSIIPLKERRDFKNRISNKSYYWYLIVLLSFYSITISMIIFYFQGNSFGSYSEDFSIAMFFDYFLGCISTIALIIYSIHLEYDISNIQKSKLTERYSHDLGNIIQVIYIATDLIKLNDEKIKNESENLELIYNKCGEAAKIIKDMRENQ